MGVRFSRFLQCLTVRGRACHLTAVDSFSQCVTNYLSLDPLHQTIRPLPAHRPAGKHVNLSVAAGCRYIVLIDDCFVEVL